MADKGTVVLGCDDNGVNDAAFMNAVQSKLESAGYTVEPLGIAPGPFANYSYSSSAQGKYGVYLMADSIVSIADYSGATGGANSSGNSFKMGVFGIRTDVITKLQGDGWNKYPIRPDGIVHGSSGEEMGDAVVEALGGKVEENEGGSASTIKDAIKEVMSAWDGEVEAFVRDMKMYIHKIKLPEQDCNLILSEGLNIESNSISVKDYCPNNTNKLVVHWNGGDDIIIQDNKRIERFGEKVKEVDAIKRVLTNGEDSKKEASTNEKEESTDKGYEEVPAETYEEALEYARLEWNRCKREDCHEIELSTTGGSEWQHGRWVRVYIPSFEIDGYYYISRLSENMSNEWKTSVTLVDYPPSFGEPKEETEEGEEEESEDTSEVSSNATNQS